MKSRTIAALLAVFMLLTLFPVPAFAADDGNSGTCGEHITWVLDDSGKLTISGTGAIPDFGWKNHAPWQSLGDKIQAIQIDDGITAIGSAAFADCPFVLTAALSDSVERIGYHAFYRCTSLKSVSLGAGVCVVNQDAFIGCSSMTTIRVANGNQTYAGFDGVLYSKDLQRLIFCPRGVSKEIRIAPACQVVEKQAFQDCDQLVNVQFSDSVQEIGMYAFYGCGSMSDIVLPSKLTTIGEHAFDGCASLTAVSVPGNVKVVSNAAFMDCSSLSSVSLSSGVEVIGAEAFSGCTELQELTLPDGLRQVGATAFYGCRALPAIELPDSVLSLGERAFQYCTSLTSVRLPSGLTTLNSSVFEHCSALKQVTLPESVNRISAAAFEWCSSLERVYIPVGVKFLGVYGFGECISLKDVYFAGTQEQWETMQNNMSSGNDALTMAKLHLEHIHSYTDTVIEPTCTTQGYTIKTCECGYSFVDPNSVIPCAAHNYGEWAEVKPAACGVAGEEKRVCADCGAEETREIAALEHSFGEWKSVTEADCETVGEEVRVCTRCGEKQTREIPALSCPSKAYTDLNTNAWYHKSVDTMLRSGYMVGVSDNEFAPNATMTRAMFVAVLYRVAGEQTVEAESGFADVPADAWYAPAVAWAAENGIVSGTSETTFSPNEPVTREQLVTILMRYSGEQAPDGDQLSEFQDAAMVSDYAVPAMQWAVANGIISGRGNHMLCPSASATRAECCQIIAVFCAK